MYVFWLKTFKYLQNSQIITNFVLANANISLIHNNIQNKWQKS